ncbi:MAG TPA: phosphatase PAP2 family protein [Chitinophagaceae bacterium]|nr:phosphatase PAP2 family protein [Chitinophagaceae bacterium]
MQLSAIMGAWEITTLIIGEVLLTLATFSAIIALIVFSIRKPIRKHKSIDLMIFDMIRPRLNTINNKIMLFITFLGKHQFLIPANLILIFYFIVVKKQTWFSIRVITIAISSLVLMLLLKQLFQRKRPLSPLLKAARGLSFPSGHAIMAVTFYGLLIYILQHTITIDWLKWILFILVFGLIILIGFSRIYLRVHYASDVLGGFIIGLLWLLISLAILKWLEGYVTSL